MVLNAHGEEMQQQQQGGGLTPPQFKLNDKQVVLCRVGGMEGQGWTFYPDGGVQALPGVLLVPRIYYTVPVCTEVKPGEKVGYAVYRAEQFQLYGTPFQMMVVEKPIWWEDREQNAFNCAPGEDAPR